MHRGTLCSIVLLLVGLVAVPQPVVGHGYPHECSEESLVETRVHEDVFVTPSDRHVIAIPVDEGDSVHVLQRIQDGPPVAVWHSTVADFDSATPVAPPATGKRTEHAVDDIDESERTARADDPAAYTVDITDPETSYLCVGNYVPFNGSFEPFQWRIRYGIDERPDGWTDARSEASPTDTPSPSATASAPTTATPTNDQQTTPGGSGPGVGPGLALVAVLLAVGIRIRDAR